jgi:hypothetical protein
MTHTAYHRYLNAGKVPEWHGTAIILLVDYKKSIVDSTVYFIGRLLWQHK